MMQMGASQVMTGWQELLSGLLDSSNAREDTYSHSCTTAAEILYLLDVALQWLLAGI